MIVILDVIHLFALINLRDWSSWYKACILPLIIVRIPDLQTIPAMVVELCV
jgi:hypothetical protein